MTQQLPVRTHKLFQFLCGGRDLISLEMIASPCRNLQSIHDHCADHARFHACASRKRQEQQRLHLDVAHTRGVEFLQKGEFVRLFIPSNHTENTALLTEEAVCATLILVESISR